MHGGDVYRNNVKYDFSISVNPLGMPQAVKEAALAAVSDAEKYPDIRCESLRRTISDKFGCAPETVVCGNGASELISAFLRMACQPYATNAANLMNAAASTESGGAGIVPRLLLLAPCFTGYEAAFRAVGEQFGAACDFSDYRDSLKFFPLLEKNNFSFTREMLPAFLEKLRTTKPAACIVTNPNNPNGKLVERAVLEEIASECEKTGTWLLIDECFMELTGKAGEYSFIPLLSRYKSVIVLRAFTKTFAIPGLRLGYCVTSCAETAAALRKQLPEWNVSAPAQAAGVAAVHEDAYLKEAVRLICEERQFLAMELKKLGFTVFPSDANFLLFRVDSRANGADCCSSEGSLFDALLEDGILIRDCRDFAGLGEGFYRIAVRKHADNVALVASLQQICGKNGENGDN